MEERFRAFLAAGYRPQLKSHLLPGSPREGWAKLIWRQWIKTGGKTTWLGDMQEDSIGWSIDAHSVIPDRPMIIGGVFATIEEALTYAEKELEKYAGKT